MHHHMLRLRVNDPDLASTELEIQFDFPIQILGSIAWRNYFDGDGGRSFEARCFALPGMRYARIRLKIASAGELVAHLVVGLSQFGSFTAEFCFGKGALSALEDI